MQTQKMTLIFGFLFLSSLGASARVENQAEAHLDALEARASKLVHACQADFLTQSESLLQSITKENFRAAYERPWLQRLYVLVHANLLPSDVPFRETFLDCWTHLHAKDHGAYTACIKGLGIGRANPNETARVVKCVTSKLESL